MSLLVGLVLGIGALAYALFLAYRAYWAGRAYLSLQIGADEQSGAFHDGETRTVRGRVETIAPAPCAEFLAGTDRAPIVVWRLRRGGRESLSASFDADRGARTTASGIAVGRFRIDDGQREIEVDPEWIASRYGTGDLRALDESDLSGRGPWSKFAWTTPYVDLQAERGVAWLDDVDSVPPELRDAIGDGLDRYQLQAKYVSPGEQLTVHGAVEVRQGVPVLGGSAETPMSISDRPPAGARDHLRNRASKVAAYAAVLLVAGTGFLAWAAVQLAG